MNQLINEVLTVKNGNFRRQEMSLGSHKDVKHFLEAGRIFGIATEHNGCLVQALPPEFSADLTHDLNWYASIVRSRPTITVPCGILTGLKSDKVGEGIGVVKDFLRFNSADKKYSSSDEYRPVVIFSEVDNLFNKNYDDPDQLKASTLMTGYMGALAMSEGSSRPLVCAVSDSMVADSPGTDPLFEIFNAQCIINTLGELSARVLRSEYKAKGEPKPQTELDGMSEVKSDVFARQVAEMGLNRVAEV